MVNLVGLVDSFVLKCSFHTTSAFAPLPRVLKGQFTRISLHGLLLHQVADEVFGCERIYIKKKKKGQAAVNPL